jgi:hypothetical protein
MGKAMAKVERDSIIKNLEKCVVILERCTKAEDAKKLRDLGMAARVWAERQKLGTEAQNSATEFVLRAERRLGEILKQTERHQGGRPGRKPITDEVRVSKRLADLGLSRNLSSRAQKIAEVSEERFNVVLEEAKQDGNGFSRERVVRQLTRPADSGIKDIGRQSTEGDAIKSAAIIEENQSKVAKQRQTLEQYGMSANECLTQIDAILRETLANLGDEQFQLLASVRTLLDKLERELQLSG